MCMAASQAASGLSGPSPTPRRAGVSSGAFGMVLFLATEAMFFTGLISAFLVLRSQIGGWPPPGQPRLPVAVTGFNTALLLLSGYTMLRALRQSRSAAGQGTRWLLATAVLGAAFLAIQGFEWVRLVGYGLTMSSTLYGGTFYTLVGAHGVHVLAALIVLLVITRRAIATRGAAPGHETLSVCAMYWTFVVAVWPILYILVYQPWGT